MHKIILLLTVFFSFSSFAAESERFQTEQNSLALIASYDESGKVRAGLWFEMEPGWKIYWRSPGDTGFPAKIDWSESSNIKSLDIKWPVPERSLDRIANLDLYSFGYKDEVLLPLEIEVVDKNRPVDFKFKVEYAICADICIPYDTSISLSLTKGQVDSEVISKLDEAGKRLPVEQIDDLEVSSYSYVEDQYGDKYIQISFTNSDIKDVDIFVENEFSLVFPKPVIKDNNARIKIPKEFDYTKLKEGMALTITKGAEGFEDILPSSFFDNLEKITISTEIETSFWFILVFAFIGGLILNVMPCVLPVLSIKILGMLKHGGQSAYISRHFLSSAFGIIFSFILIAAIVVYLKSFGANIGWGFHFQQPYFLITLSLVVVLFALNLFGFYEIQLPGRLNNLIYQKSSGESVLGYFLSGVLAAVLATPCTAPFVGVSVGFALSQDSLVIFAIFTVMGVGLALPYLLICSFPKLISFMPKPGAWMVVVKKIMAVLLVLTSCWLVWILSQQIGEASARILIFILLLIALSLYPGFWKTTKTKLIITTILIIFAYVLPFDYAKEVKKQPKELWQEFKPEKISSYVDGGKIVFVDVTADWCLTCKTNKFLVLDSAEIVDRLSQKDIIAMQADWTSRDDKIANYLKSHQRLGIPFNIVYGPADRNGVVLSELLSKSEVLDAIEAASGQN